MFETKRSFYTPLHDHGFWSPSTASANFCEEDYNVSYYVAEFINTISNLAYIYYALRTPSVDITTGNSTSKGKQLRTRHKVIWDLHTLSLIAVGLTSGLYHMSMRPLPQWLDESSMYVLAASFIHALLTTSYKSASKTDANGGKLTSGTSTITHQNQLSTTVGIASLLATTSFISHQTGNLTIHSATFGLALVLSGLKLIYLIFTFDNLHQRDPRPKVSFLGFKVTASQRILILKLFKAWGLLNLAFTLWLMDCNPGICAWLRWVRNDILGQFWWLRPLGFLTELHGWWHILTAKAAGEYIGLIRTLTTA